MRPFSADLMRMWPISTRVNKPENDDPSIVEPVAGAGRRLGWRALEVSRRVLARAAQRGETPIRARLRCKIWHLISRTVSEDDASWQQR